MLPHLKQPRGGGGQQFGARIAERSCSLWSLMLGEELLSKVPLWGFKGRLSQNNGTYRWRLLSNARGSPVRESGYCRGRHSKG